MASGSQLRDQQHPQENSDRKIIERLLQEEPSDTNKTELARLRIRYTGFPGAREIQSSLDRILQQWQLTEEQLFEMTRQIHQRNRVQQRNNSLQSQEDWN